MKSLPSLKPCPFCRNEPLEHISPIHGTKYYRCGSNMCPSYGMNWVEKEAWNTRAGQLVPQVQRVSEKEIIDILKAHDDDEMGCLGIVNYDVVAKALVGKFPQEQGELDVQHLIAKLATSYLVLEHCAEKDCKECANRRMWIDEFHAWVKYDEKAQALCLAFNRGELTKESK